MYRELCHLLPYRFDEWCISIAVSNVVNLIINIPRTLWLGIFFFRSNKWNVSVFLASKRFPFDMKNPVGYSIAIVIEYITCGYEFFTVACTLSVVIGSYWVSISATKEIQHILHSINDKTRANENHPNEFGILFAEFIDAHAAVKQLSWHKVSISYPHCILLPIIDFFQIGPWFFGYLSTHSHVPVHMESLCNLRCHAYYSNRNSWVHFTFQNEDFVIFFFNFHNFCRF